MGEIFLGNIKGKDGKDGNGLKILGFCIGIADLEATAPNPSVGDAYAVGLEAPYDTYIYSADRGWVNMGALNGVKGDKGEDGKNATITGVTATVDDTTGTPSVQVTLGGTETERSIDFAFSGLKGGEVTVNADGGIAIGTDAIVDNTLTDDGSIGVAIGDFAVAGAGSSLGWGAITDNGSAVGYGAISSNGGAVGCGARAGDGFSGGKDAIAENGIDAIQLGTGTNKSPKTLQVYDYTMMNADGKIPIDRLPQEIVKLINDVSVLAEKLGVSL